MKKPAIFLVLTLASLAVVPVLAARQGGPVAPFEIGKTVPGDITLTDLDGKVHKLADYRGKVVFIHFWSIVCPYEKLAEPKCKDLQSRYADKGVVQIAINANQGELKEGPPYAKLREHVQQAGVNFIVTVDPGAKVADVLGGQTTPHCFVIDRNGVLQYQGALDDDPKGTKGESATPYVKNAIEAVLAGQPVPVATSKPYG
ncbi:MAG: redoxin family protein [Vicinamibacterales bacterium]